MTALTLKDYPNTDKTGRAMIAADMAAAIGGSVVETESYWRFSIVSDRYPNIVINLIPGRPSKNRVEISIHHRDSIKLLNYHNFVSGFGLQPITVDGEKSMLKVAVDIERRLVAYFDKFEAAFNAAYTEQEADKQKIRDLAAKYSGIPNLKVTIDSHTVRLDYSDSSIPNDYKYATMRVYETGDITVDRCSGIKRDKLKEFLALL